MSPRPLPVVGGAQINTTKITIREEGKMKGLQFTVVLAGILVLLGTGHESTPAANQTPTAQGLTPELARVVLPPPAEGPPTAETLSQFFAANLPADWRWDAILMGLGEPLPERIPHEYKPTDEWLADLQCFLFGGMYGSLPDAMNMPYPQDAGLLENPFTLWKVGGLRLGPVITASRSLRAANGKLDYRAVKRIAAELSDTTKPGDIVIVRDPGYGTVTGSPLFTGCKQGRKPLDLAPADYRPWPPWETWNAKVLVAQYWSGLDLQLHNGIRYYYLKEGKAPQSRADLARAIGPENEKAWNPWVAMYIERVVPRIQVERYHLVRDLTVLRK
jgi:hypothetical protein